MIEATTVVSFNKTSDTTDYVFNLELDDILNLDSEGEPKSSFSPDDVVYILANKSSNVSITAVKSTAGNVSNLGGVSRNGDTTNLFAGRDPDEDDTFELGIIPTSVDISYIGNLGRLSEEVSGIGVRTYTHNVDYAPFIAEFNYNYNCASYKLSPPPMDLGEGESFPIAVVFYITVSEA